MVSTQSFILPEVKTTIILSGDKYIVIYHPSANIAPYSAQATRSLSFLVKSKPQFEALAFPLALFAFWSSFLLAALCFFCSSVLKVFFSLFDISEGSIVTKIGQCASASFSRNNRISFVKYNKSSFTEYLYSRPSLLLPSLNVSAGVNKPYSKKVNKQQSPILSVSWRTSWARSTSPPMLSRRYFKSKYEMEWNCLTLKFLVVLQNILEVVVHCSFHPFCPKLTCWHTVRAVQLLVRLLVG